MALGTSTLSQLEVFLFGFVLTFKEKGLVSQHTAVDNKVFPLARLNLHENLLSGPEKGVHCPRQRCPY